MKNIKKQLALLLALTLIATCFAACAKKADDDWSYISGKKTLVIGFTDYAPMNYYEDGKLIGFDTEFAEALCKKLNLTPEFIEIEWDNKEVELSGKTIDCIWNGLTVSEERKANMAFTTSYLKNEQCVVIRAEDAAKYTAAADFKGAVVVAEAGSAGETAVAADMADASFTAVGAQSDALLEVKAGTAAAAVIDITMAKTMVGAGTDYADLAIVTSIDMMDEEYAVGLRVGSTAVEKFNAAVSELAADGTLAALAEKYGLTDLLIKN